MISIKQKKILAFPYSRYDALICDGAVRSGKTSIIMWAFIEWAMREFNGQRFGICGKTVDSRGLSPCTAGRFVYMPQPPLARRADGCKTRCGTKMDT